MNIFPYEDKHKEDLLALWNASLPLDPLDDTNLGLRLLWDKNFDPEKLLMAYEGARAVGFAYGVMRLVPDEIAGMEAGKGYVVAMGVDVAARRAGVGGKLLAALEAKLAAAGARTIVVGAYADNYFCPGVDNEAYAAGRDFFAAKGYAVGGTAVSMQVDLHGYSYPAKTAAKRAALLAQGYSFAPFAAQDTVSTLAFMRREFAHWLPPVREAMRAMHPEALLIAKDPDGHVVGFVMRAMDGTPERFGPFGVGEAMQGKSVGSVLFHDLMLSMQKKRIYHTYFLWTSGRNVDYYGHWGMEVYRSYDLMKKENI